MQRKIEESNEYRRKPMRRAGLVIAVTAIVCCTGSGSGEADNLIVVNAQKVQMQKTKVFGVVRIESGGEIRLTEPPADEITGKLELVGNSITVTAGGRVNGTGTLTEEWRQARSARTHGGTGGSYGGRGGAGDAETWIGPYGAERGPDIDTGSYGSSGPNDVVQGGYAGGMVILRGETVVVDGSIQCNGGHGQDWQTDATLPEPERFFGGGGGSGGGILIIAKHLTIGPNARITANGWAKLQFEVSMQPGDNYRIVASLLNDYAGDVKAKQNDTEGRIVFINDQTQTPIPSKYNTEMLTVWRKIHIELDKMSSPGVSEKFNTVSGTSTALTSTSLTANGSPGWGTNCLNGGVLDPDDSTAPTSVDFFGDNSFEVASNGSDTLTIRSNYREDRFDNDNDSEVDEADETYNMDSYSSGNDFAVNTDDEDWDTLLNDLDENELIQGIGAYYSDAYINCVKLTSGNTNDEWGFARNSDSFSTVDVEGSSDFLTVTLGLAYEYKLTKEPFEPNPSCGPQFYGGDDDPEDEGVAPGYMACVYGVVPSIPEDKCLVFIETYRDRPLGGGIARTAAHEIGHDFGLQHSDYEAAGSFEATQDGIMGWTKPPTQCMKTWMDLIWAHNSPNRFSDTNIDQLRSNLPE